MTLLSDERRDRAGVTSAFEVRLTRRQSRRRYRCRMDAPAVVVAWDPGWQRDFWLVAARLAPVLPAGATVEHVGSTAVSGLAAKPIIDIDVIVPDAATSHAAVKALERLGYEHREDLGIAGREAFTVLPGLPYHHLYVVIVGNKPLRDHINLRDYLRSRPDQAERYANEKRRLAHLLLSDRDEYVRQKGLLVEAFMIEANTT